MFGVKGADVTVEAVRHSGRGQAGVQYPGACRKVRPARATRGLLDDGTQIVDG